jgi:Ca2+-binding EF-hand superfamily protein
VSVTDAKRLERQAADRNFRAWKSKKANGVASERTKRIAERRAKKEEEAKTKAARIGAHEKWVERKKQEGHTPLSKHRKRSHFTGSLMIDEFVSSLRRNRYQSALLPLFEDVLQVLDPDNTGRVNRAGFLGLLAQVSLQGRIDARIDEILTEREANPLPEKRQAWSTDQRNAALREALEQRIGEKVIFFAANGLRNMSKLLRTADRIFSAADEDLSGSLKEDALKGCFKGLALGISATDQIEVVKIMRADGGSDRIDYALFGDYLVTVEARRQLQPEFLLHKSLQYEMAERLCHNGSDDVYSVFDTCCADATEYRKAVNHRTCGWVNIKHFRSTLNNVHENFPTTKRKDVVKAIETYCKMIDHDNDGVVELARIDLFLRTIEVEIEHKAARDAIPAELRRRHDTKLRYWKIAIANVSSHGSFEKMQLAVTTAVTSCANDDSTIPYIAPVDFVMCLKKVDVGLSSVQIDELVRVYRAEGEGLGVCLVDVLDDFAEAKIKADLHAARKVDKRIQLAADMLRALGSSVPKLHNLLLRYQEVLMTWDAPKLGESKPEVDACTEHATEAFDEKSLTESTEPIKVAKATGSTFDVTWGHDVVTHLPIQMPLGRHDTNAKIQLVR